MTSRTLDTITCAALGTLILAAALIAVALWR